MKKWIIGFLAGALILTVGVTIPLEQALAAPAKSAQVASGKSTTTSVSTKAVAGLNADEQKMLELVNQERVKAGLKPFKVDMALVRLARMKSQDMIDKKYFDHQSPTYGSPFEMMQANGVRYQTAGENLAGNGSVVDAHNSLMQSPGHRANLLNPSFTKIGIGVVNGGEYGKMFTQMFIG